MVSYRYRDSDVATVLGLESGPAPAPGAPAETPGREPWALRDVDLTVAEGERVAIVGRSGSGKSTLLAMLAGLVVPTHGRVLVRGSAPDGLEPEDRSKRVWLVTQDAFFFRTTVRANLLYGIAPVDDEALWAACAAANVATVIERLPHGLDTLLGEQGLTLSGGERQRLALARALVRDPAVLLLDEPTAHLDPEATQAVQEGLRALTAKRTVVTAAHDESSVSDVDRLYVMRDGRLADEIDCRGVRRTATVRLDQARSRR